MTELDKFKRRLVRSVSHLVKESEAEQVTAWERLQKETGCDCKLLWERMRALTIKKMKRLLAADDCVDNIAAVARMSHTDWLIFDLVIVHQKFDVIGREQLLRGGKERAILTELFNLVLEFSIESLQGYALAEAWSTLTRKYNCKSGRLVSPMLLQRRWYQLKDITRNNFYKLWNNYRGNAKLWEIAKRAKPTDLQSLIAKSFPGVITMPFPDWDEQIRIGRVILPEQFQSLKRLKSSTKQDEDDKADLEVIEPEIETIDLGGDSDGEGTSSQSTPALEINLALVKKEPLEDGLTDVQILDTSHIPVVQQNTQVSSNTNVSDQNVEDETQYDQPANEDSNTASDLAEITDSPDPDTPDDLIKQKAEEYFKMKIENVMETNIGQDDTVETKSNSEDDIVDDIIKQKADDFVRKVDIKKLVSDVLEDMKTPSSMTIAEEGIEFVDEGIEYVENDGSDHDVKKIELKPTVPAEVEAKKEVPETLDAKVDYKKYKPYEDNKNNDKEGGVGSTNSDDTEQPKFDLKLLMAPVVYTTKLDDMIVFKSKKFNFVQLKHIIDSVVLESKPVSDRAIKVEVEYEPSQVSPSQKENESNDNLFRNNDVKLDHVNPISYETPQLHISKNNSDDLESSNAECGIQSKNPSSNECENNTNEQIDEKSKVNATSYLLQKPRSRSYNPIQLCKNPDFNTRLKRLTAGFFSSARNRQLLSACKPMTVDMHKAFEDKLIDGTLYLKSSGEIAPVFKKVQESPQSTSVIPSAMPIQSLLSNDNKNLNLNELISSTSQIDTVDLTQRSKTINLPNLTEIRRINQHLLTAQVPPMRVQNLEKSLGPEPVAEVARQEEVNKQAEESVEPQIINVVGGLDVTCDNPPPVLQEIDITNTIDNKDGGAVESNRVQDASNDVSTTTAVEFKEHSTTATYNAKETSRGRGRGGTGRWRGGMGRGGLINKGTPPWWLSGYKPVEAPWRKGVQPPPEKIDDFLITIDTLNRMINKLDGTEEFKNPGKKNKCPNWSIDKNVLKKQTSNTAEVDRKDTDKTKSKVSENLETVSKDLNKEAVDLKIDCNDDVALNVTVVDTADADKTDNKSKRRAGRRPKSCCWSRAKIEQTRVRLRHKCPQICECCCRQDYLVHLKKLVANKQTISLANDDSDAIVLSDEEPIQADLLDNDSNDVRIPGFDPDPEPPTPKIRVYESKSNDAETSCSYKHGACTSTCVGRGLPLNVAGVSSIQDNTVSVTQNAPEVDIQPVIRINVNFAPAPSAAIQPEMTPIIAQIDSLSNENSSSSILEQIASQIVPSPSPVPSVAAKAVVPKIAVPQMGLVAKSHTPIIQTLRQQIVIDGSSSSTIATKTKLQQNAERVLFLNSKSIANKPKESPIFLGKNKILLTTVKFPKSLTDENEAPNMAIQPSRVIPALPLPQGVQLVLLPSGMLTYAVDPGVQLNEEQMATLPKILATVQEQINISNKKLENPDNTDQSITGNLNTKETANLSGDNEGQTSNQSKELNKSDDSQNLENIKETSKDEDKTTSSVNELNNSKESNIITINENENTLESNTSDNNDVSGSRNLLSDLMEMSGISAEDARPQESRTESSDSTKSMDLLCRESASLDTTANSTIPISGTISELSSSLSVLSENTSSGVPPSDTIPSLPELSPITSLAELKYACDNNGLFYKLDLETGIIALINVCIKKNVVNKTRSRFNVPPIAPKSVIDLTDDGDTESNNANVASDGAVLKMTSYNVAQDGTVKPIRLFKSAKFTVVKHSNLLKKKYSVNQTDIQNVTQSKKHKKKRKQNLDRIEAQIDLVDSDAPMEEEYLLDDSEDDECVKSTTSNIVDTDSEDSSDEEPLSKKFKRLKDQQIELSNKLTLNNEDNANETDGLKDIQQTQTEEISTEATTALAPSGKEPAVEKGPDNISADDMEIEEPEFLSFLEEQNESQDDDCILGV